MVLKFDFSVVWDDSSGKIDKYDSYRYNFT